MSCRLIYIILAVICYQYQARTEYPEKEKPTKKLSEATCPSSRQLEILSLRTADPSSDVCDEPLSCSNTSNGHCCLQTLNAIYQAADTGNRTLLPKVHHKHWTLTYACVPVRAEVANPCAHDDLKPDVKFKAILFSPISEKSPCRQVCRLKAQGAFKVAYSFLLKHNNAFERSYLEYQIVSQEGIHFSWRIINSSPYHEDDTFYFNVSEIVINFRISDMSTVTRLWIHLQGTYFTLSCRQSSNDITIRTNVPNIMTMTSPPDGSDEDTDNAVIIYHAIAGGFIFIAGVIIAIFCIVRKKRKSEVQNDNPPLLSGQDNSYSTITYDCPRSLSQPGTSNLPHSGNDVTEYNTLQRHQRGQLATREGGTGAYDIARSGTGAGEYHNLKRDPRRVMVLDSE